MNSFKVIRQMNSLTAILLQMNSTATPLLSLLPCACNTATPLPTRRCPADQNTALEMPSSHHTAAVQLLLTLPDARTKKMVMMRCQIIHSHLITSLLHRDSHRRRLNGRHSDWMGTMVLLLPNQINHPMTMICIE